MRRLAFFVTVAALTTASNAFADNNDKSTCPTAPLTTWGRATPASNAAAATPPPPPPSVDESPVSRAKDLLARARLLDDAATADDKNAIEIAARIPTLRTTAKSARDKADRSSGDDREVLVSRAEDLEADLAISEAETTAKRKSAIDNRRIARELRARAVRLVKEAPVEPPAANSPCDPPYRFTSDGRKIYRVECLK